MVDAAVAVAAGTAVAGIAVLAGEVVVVVLGGTNAAVVEVPHPASVTMLNILTSNRPCN